MWKLKITASGAEPMTDLEKEELSIDLSNRGWEEVSVECEQDPDK
jgi:hypothetical protein